jgi:putative membrane protein (TIGR04086 family)
MVGVDEMVQKQNGNNIPVRPILKGSLFVILVILLFTVLLGLLTETGWTGTVKWSSSLYLIIIYLSIIAGSVIAGLKSARRGWITGVGVGLIGSLFILFLAILAGEMIRWPIYLIKTLINIFLGAFGGILGVNFSNADD